MNTNSTWAVILTDTVKPALPEVGEALAKLHKIPFQDGVHLARPRWGLVAENLPLPEAERLIGLLKKAPLSCLCVPEAHVALHRDPRTAEAVRFSEQGLELCAKKNDWKTLPWPSIQFIAAAAFKTKISKILKSEEGPSMEEKLLKTSVFLATGLPLPTKKKKEVQTKVEETEIRFYLDLFPNHSTLRIRLNALSLNYQFLGEKMQVGSQVNFRIFLQELARKAPLALCNEGVKTLISEKPVPLEIYDNEQDFDTECRWRLTLAALKSSS